MAFPTPPSRVGGTSRVLVIGAGGVFGSRLAAGLVRHGFEIVVAGRSLARAEATAEALRGAGGVVSAAALDTRTLNPVDLTATGAGIVVDAAGPFQGARPRVAQAAIAAGLHYVDLADARDFVASFGTLDEAATAAGVVVLSGASSTPALSSAVLDELTRGWSVVTSVEAAISPGARAPRGVSVTAAILSWAGRPVQVFEAGAWRKRPGWSGSVRRRFGAAGPRWVSLCETPDLDILAARFRPTDRALFMAGLEPGVLHWATAVLTCISGRAGIDLRPAAGLLNALSRWVPPFGSDKGAMRVEALGIDAQGRAVRALWRLVAEPGVGPVTPTLPALAAIRAIANGSLKPGARACIGDLTLADIEAEMAHHALVTDRTTERGAIFARAIGVGFDALPAPLRALHETPGRSVWRGEAVVDGPANVLAAMVGWLIGFPARAGVAPVEVLIDADGRRSIWRRRIGKACFVSVLSRPQGEGRISERFGLVTVNLRLRAEPYRLVYQIDGWRFGPLPLPIALAPRTRTHEAVDDAGRFTFDVEIGMPLLGRVVRYRGWLVRASEQG